MSHIWFVLHDSWQRTKLQESTLRLALGLESLHSLVYYTHGGCMPMTSMSRCAWCEPWSVLPCCMVTGTCQDLCFSRWTSRVLSVRNLWCILHFSIPFPSQADNIYLIKTNNILSRALTTDLQSLGYKFWALYGTHSFRWGGCQYRIWHKDWTVAMVAAWGGWSQVEALTMFRYFYSPNDNHEYMVDYDRNDAKRARVWLLFHVHYSASVRYSVKFNSYVTFDCKLESNLMTRIVFGSQINCKFPVQAVTKPPSHFDCPTQPASKFSSLFCFFFDQTWSGVTVKKAKNWFSSPPNWVCNCR